MVSGSYRMICSLSSCYYVLSFGRLRLVLVAALIHRSIQRCCAECTNLSACVLIETLEGTLTIFWHVFS